MDGELNMEKVDELRTVIQTFVNGRLKKKLDELRPDQLEKRDELIRKYQLDVWLDCAAKRVGHIQLATHIIKPMHPDAIGTSLYTTSLHIDERGLVGTHSLPTESPVDAVGSAANLDVFKFLNLEDRGKSLLDRILGDDAQTKSALSDDPAKADELCIAFAGITKRKEPLASHALARQVYFPSGEIGEYHLLAPLFPTTLVHTMYQTVREHRFGERAKKAREARRNAEPWSEGFHEYPQLAIRNLGGTKPQNISQLNSERHGENWLLASLPPNWDSPRERAPFNVDSVFDRKFGSQRHVREITRELRRFLQATQYNNINIRRNRARLVEAVCDEAVQFAANLRELPPGWSAAPECRLNESERLWLDPVRAVEDEEFKRAYRSRNWPREVSDRFANWLNRAIGSRKSLLGDAEHREWAGELSLEIEVFRDDLEADRD